MIKITNIWKFDLRKGNSNDPKNGACLLDAVSWFEYGKLGDHPACVCPVIAAFGRIANDAMTDIERQKLKVFIPRLIETVDRESEQARAEFLAWQAIHVFAPIALDAIGLRGEASKLRMVSDWAAARAAAMAARAAAWAAARAARAAARAAADAAADAAARAAGAAARAAAGAAGAAGAAAWAAAEAAVDVAARAEVNTAIIAALDGVLKIGRQAVLINEVQIISANRSFELAAS